MIFLKMKKKIIIFSMIINVILLTSPLTTAITTDISNNIYSTTGSENTISYPNTVKSNGISPSVPFSPQVYNCTDDEYLIYGSNIFAQSFTTSKGKLNDVSLKLRRIGNPAQGLTVSIYDSINDNKLASVSKSANEIPTFSSWVKFDFDDLKVYQNGAIWVKKYDGIGVADDSSDFLFQTINGQGQIDQEWTHCSGLGEIIFSDDVYYAQSFKPSSSKISKIALALGRKGNPPNLIVSIMRTLDGEELTKISIPSEDVPVEGWLEIDCEDINVNIGQTYYIVCRTTGGDIVNYNFYSWWFGFNDNGQYPAYERGERWVSYESGRYYIVCKTIGGDSNNCYAWGVESHENSYYNGACYESKNNGNTWEEHIYDDMFFKLGEGNGGDQLDQYQHVFSGTGRIICGDMWVAQSFLATGNNLSKIRLLIFANLPPKKSLTVSIRKDLNGNDLTSISRYSSDFYYYDGIPHWYEFDFKDINTNPGQTYYIVCRSPGLDDDSGYAWGHMMSRSNDYYPAGSSYYSYDGDKNWSVNNDFGITDQCFETYYRASGESSPKQKPFIPFLRLFGFFSFLQYLTKNLIL